MNSSQVKFLREYLRRAQRDLQDKHFSLPLVPPEVQAARKVVADWETASATRRSSIRKQIEQHIQHLELEVVLGGADIDCKLLTERINDWQPGT